MSLAPLVAVPESAVPESAVPGVGAPRPPPVQYETPLGTRWQKEKAAAGGEHAFEFVDDPKYIGPWILGECVGKGASGRVKIAKHRRTGQLAAVKILPLEPSLSSRASLRTRDAKSEKFRLGIDREIITMKLMRHPNIMRIYDVYEGERELYLVLEYVEGGELFDFLVNRGRMHPERALMYFKQIIAGLNYAHTFSIVHRDLKPENILIQSIEPPIIKIADWGMAAFNPPSSQLGTSCGSPHYASPEIVNGEKYCGPMSDIWSCGVILYALLTGRLPFDDKDVRKLLAKVRVGHYELYDWIHPQARDLIARMLVVDVTKRITMAEILEHPWMVNPTPGIIVHPSPSVAELARPFVSSAFIEEEVLESLYVVCGKQMSFEQLTAELCSPAGQGEFVKAFYYLLDQHRRLTLHENGIYLDVHSDDPSAKRVSKQYSRPVSRAASRTYSSLEVDPRGQPSPKTPPVGPLPPPPTTGSHVPAGAHSSGLRTRAPSPAGPRQPQTRRATSPDSRGATSLRPPASPAHETPSRSHHRSGLPIPSRSRGAHRARTLPSPCDASPAPKTPLYINHCNPVLTDSPVSGAAPFVPPVAGLPSPAQPQAEHAFLRPEAVIRPTPVRAGAQGSHPLFAAPRVQDAALQSSIDAIAIRMNTLAADRERFGAHTRAVTEYGAPHGQAEAPRRRAETAGGRHMKNGGDKENHVAEPAAFAKPEHILALKDTKGAESKRKARPAPLDLQGDSNRRALGAVPQSPALLSPAVELRGWFQNLFSWKQSYHLRSRENVARTRDEIAYLLSTLGIGLVGEDIGGRLALRCIVEDGAVLSGPNSCAEHRAAKGVSFRVELHVAPPNAADSSFLPLSPSTPGSGKKAMRSVPGTPGPGECVALLVQEKGSIATFRAVYQRLRQMWTLDVPSPTTAPASSGWPAPVQEHAQAQFVY